MPTFINQHPTQESDMHRNLLTLAAMLAVLAMADEAQATCTAANPNANVAESTPSSAFIDHGNGTVTHSLTGLMWKQCAQGLSGTNCATGTATTMAWSAALTAAKNDATAGYSDWRLPNKKELESIVESCGHSPAINQTLFPATPASGFWSGSTYVPAPSNAWYVYFNDGNSSANNKAASYYVRLVRGGQSFASFDAQGDFTPTAFSFTAQTGAALSTAITSNILIVAGMTTVSSISVSGGSYALNGGAYTTAAGSVNNGDMVTVRQTSSGSYSTLTTATVTIGGVAGAFNVTTAAAPAPAAPAPTEDDVGPGGSITAGYLPLVSLGGGTIVFPKGSTGGKVTLQDTGAALQATKLVIWDQTLSAKPLGGTAVFNVKTASYQGQTVLVVQMSSGTASFTAPVGMPILVLGGGVIAAGGNGAATTASGDKLAVTGGSVTITADSNAFAADATLTAYAGEVIEKNSQGKLVLRVGSLSGSDGATGDPVKGGNAALPPALNLGGPLGRLGGASPLDTVASAYAQTGLQQNADGSLGPSLRALPVSLRIDPARADGIQTLGGLSEVAKSGLVIQLAPTLGDTASFTGQVDRSTGKTGAWLSEDSDGVLNISAASKQFVARPSLRASATGNPDGFATDAQGNLEWDSQGHAQTIYPAFRYPAKLRAALTAIDPAATLIDNGDGSYSATLNGRAFLFRPSYAILNLFDFPATHLADSGWQENGMVYINYGNVTAQGFVVK